MEEKKVRLIDADALIEKMPTVMDMQDTYLPIHFKEWLIDTAPSIDIVRCKDCKWCLVEEGGCERIGMVLFADEIENHFCGYGERRRDE